jgi:hypothetical protein
MYQLYNIFYGQRMCVANGYFNVKSNGINGLNVNVWRISLAAGVMSKSYMAIQLA